MSDEKGAQMHWQRISALGELRGFRLSWTRWRAHHLEAGAATTGEAPVVRLLSISPFEAVITLSSQTVQPAGAVLPTAWHSLHGSQSNGRVGRRADAHLMSDATDGSGRAIFSFTICVSHSL